MAEPVPLSRDCIVLDLQAQTRDEVLSGLAAALGRLDPELVQRREELLQAMREREQRGSTASQKVAIPHVKLPGLQRVSLVVAVSQRGVDFQALDGERVHVFFSLVRPAEGAEQHLQLLRWIASVALHKDFVPFARQARTPEQIIDLLYELAPA